MRGDALRATAVLLLLSPFTAEVLTGSTRLTDFVNPFVLAMLVGLYGLGALLIREAKLYLRLSYVGVAILGFAYGVVEEGIAVKSFFNPHWRDLGILGTYGRWGGVNWVWAVHLTVFHGVWSILAPIVLVEALYPTAANTHWVGRRGLATAMVLFSADVALINVGLTRYAPSLTHYILCFAAIAALTVLAPRIDHMLSNGATASARASPPRYGAYWAAWAVAFFASMYALPALIPWPAIPVTTGALIGVTALILVKRLSYVNYGRLHAYWLYAGVASVLIAMDFLQALRPSVERLTVGLLGITVLLTSYAGVRHRRSPAPGRSTCDDY